eukprot:Platyproteum_vivax@DN224_c0_g1_i1.p1
MAPLNPRQIFNRQKGIDVFQDEGTYKKMMQLFKADFAPKVAQIKTLYKTDDLVSLSAEVHSMKGSASYLAGDELVAVCDKVYVALSAKKGGDVLKKLMGEFDVITKLAMAELNQM